MNKFTEKEKKFIRHALIWYESDDDFDRLKLYRKILR